MDLDARPYRCFAAVADTGSFRKAADRLNMSQPALSAQIRELERRLGFPLFARTGRSAHMTSQALLFLPSVRRIIGEADVIRMAAEDIRLNQLRIGATTDMMLIPQVRRLIERFMAIHPAVPLRISNDDMTGSLAALRAGESDVLVAILPGEPVEQEEAPLPASIEAQTLGEQPIGLLVPSEHDWAVQRCVSPERVADQAIVRIGRDHGRPLSDAINNWLLAMGSKPVRAPEGSALGVERHAAFTRSIGVTLGWWDGVLVADGGMVRIDVRKSSFQSRLVLLRHRGAHRAGAQLFWDFASEEMQY